MIGNEVIAIASSLPCVRTVQKPTPLSAPQNSRVIDLPTSKGRALPQIHLIFQLQDLRPSLSLSHFTFFGYVSVFGLVSIYTISTYVRHYS